MTEGVHYQCSSGSTHRFYCLAMVLVFLGASYYRHSATGELAPSIPWLVPALFWVIEYFGSIWIPYVRIAESELTLRRWTLLPSVRVKRTEIESYEFDGKNFQVRTIEGEERRIDLNRVKPREAEELSNALERWLSSVPAVKATAASDDRPY